MEGADGEEIRCSEDDQRNNESEEEREESVQVLLPFRRVDPVCHTLVEGFLKRSLSYVKHHHLKQIRKNH